MKLLLAMFRLASERVVSDSKASSGLLKSAWHYRAAAFGLLAIALAVVGEALMRTAPGGVAANAELGTWLVRVAVLLVGLVAWVRDGFTLGTRLPGESGKVPVQGAPLVARKVRQRGGEGNGVSPSGAAARYAAWRERAGWKGTAVALLIAVALAAACLLLLWRDFRHPLAPWLWLAMLVVLLLAFVGMRPPRGVETLLPHDPHEPAREPRVSRVEWLAIGAILLVALVLRVWNLEYVPTGPYADEGDRALDARRVNLGEPLTDSGPFTFFGTGWWGVPNLYFWLVAQSLNLFGDNLAGVRMVHALAGVGAVWFAYRTARVAWSPRAGLMAGVLLALSDFAIQFSRTAGESAIMIFTWVACFYFLYNGLKSLRPLDFALSGLLLGLTLYSYVAGKLLPPLLVVVAVYLLVRWGLRGVKAYLPGLALVAVVAILTYAPNALYVLSHLDAFGKRYDSVAIWGARSREITNAYRTDDWTAIVPRQFAVSYAAFDVAQERGPFYPTRQPVLPVPWAALWVLGSAYVIWRVGDARYGILGLWVIGGLAAAALTVETPSVQRVAGMVPALAIVPALFLDRVASGLPVVGAWGVRRVRWAVAAGLALLVLAVGAQGTLFYFGEYAPQARYHEFTVLGRYAQGLDPQKDVVYHSGFQVLLGTAGPTLFLAKDVPVKEFGNVSDDLPLRGDEGKNIHFLFFPHTDSALGLLASFYPGGRREIINDAQGKPFAGAFRVSAQEIAASQALWSGSTTGLRGMYYLVPGGRDLLGESDLRLGEAQPVRERLDRVLHWRNINGGTEGGERLFAVWEGSLHAKEGGAYEFDLDTDGAGSIWVDGKLIGGRRVPGSTLRLPVTVHLNPGEHPLEVRFAADKPANRFVLLWKAPGGVWEAVPPLAFGEPSSSP